MNTQGDHALLRAHQAGDGDAFDALVRRYQNRIYNLCFRILGQEQEAWDAAQETFLKAFRAAGRFRFESGVYTWLYRIAANTCKNRLRRPGPRRADPEEAAALPNGAPSALERLEAAQKARLLQQAIDALPAEQRIIVVLRDVEGVSYEEIAQITGLALGTVKSRLARGRGALRKRLARFL